MTNISFGRDVEKIAKIIHTEMPALRLTIWDMTPFIPHMHNWRKNIIFVECDRAAIHALAGIIDVALPGYGIYLGIKKPIRMGMGVGEKKASIVIIAREATFRREVEGIYPKIEKCLVDLLYYAKNETLPLSLRDVLDLWEYYLINKETIRFNELYRYSTRRYLGWFVSIFAYELSKKNHLRIDERHYKTGARNLELIKMVTRHE